MSLASDAAAALQQQQENTIGYYNLLWGPVAWCFASGLEVDYDDNVRLLSQNPQGDLIFRPSLKTQTHWPVTPKNSLDVSLDAGYSFYMTHSGMDQLYVNPGSGLSFNIYAGDCVINLSESRCGRQWKFRTTGKHGRCKRVLGLEQAGDPDRV